MASNEESDLQISKVSLSDLDTVPVEVELLKGDAIGDTAYSERFVLKTLMGLQEVEWSEAYETQLETLWDMSNDSEVSQYLFDKGFIEMLPSLIQHNFENVRLVEILVGIIGNMCCFIPLNGNELLKYLIMLMTYPDASTLEQVIRSITSIMYCNKDQVEEMMKVLTKEDSFVLRLSEILVTCVKGSLILAVVDLLINLDEYCEWKHETIHENILITDTKLVEAFLICISTNEAFDMQPVNTNLFRQTMRLEKIFRNHLMDLPSDKQLQLTSSDLESITTFYYKLICSITEVSYDILKDMKEAIHTLNVSSIQLLKQSIRIGKDDTFIPDPSVYNVLHHLILLLAYKELKKTSSLEEFLAKCELNSMEYLYSVLKKYTKESSDVTGAGFEDILLQFKNVQEEIEQD